MSSRYRITAALSVLGSALYKSLIWKFIAEPVTITVRVARDQPLLFYFHAPVTLLSIFRHEHISVLCDNMTILVLCRTA